MKAFCRLALLLALLLGKGNPAHASQQSDSLFVDVEGDSTHYAVRVTPSELGFLTLIRADGAKSYVMEKDVRAIHDSGGQDWTERVLNQGKGVGTAPIIPRETKLSTNKIPKLRGRPSPIQKAFPIIQVGFLWRVDDAKGWTREAGSSVVGDLGGMQNISRHFALGATMHLAFSETLTRMGAKARVRWWLGETTSLDLAPGALFSGKDDDYASPMWTTEATLAFGDWVAVTTQVEVRRREGTSTPGYPAYIPYWYEGGGPAHDTGGTDVTWLFGIKIGGELGLFSFLPVMAFGAAMGTMETTIP